MREKIMLSGESNTSKTMSLVKLAILYPNKQVVILDPDDGTAKLLGEFGLTMADLPNLNIIPVRSDYANLLETYGSLKTTLGEGDWLCFDMLGRFWDLAQQYYSRRVFGEDPVEHLITLRKQAQNVSFGGFDGLQDWPLIKRLHGEKLIDDAVVAGVFNVMATTSVTTYLPVEKVPKKGVEAIYANEFGIKPEGEKHNPYRFDTQAVLYRKADNTYWFRLVRDRGRAVDVKREFNITGRSFWEVYAEHRGIAL